jgi:hypothetical protein
MTYINNEFFKKRPSEELLEKTMESIEKINPELLKEFDDLVDDWKKGG